MRSTSSICKLSYVDLPFLSAFIWFKLRLKRIVEILSLVGHKTDVAVLCMRGEDCDLSLTHVCVAIRWWMSGW